MKSYESKKVAITSLIEKRIKYITNNTSWFHIQIGTIKDVKDVTQLEEDDKASLNEIFFRDIELTLQIKNDIIIKNPKKLLRNIETKKIGFSYPLSWGLLNYTFIEPQIKIINKKKNLMLIKGQIEGNFKNIVELLKGYGFYKCDFQKHFECKILKNIVDGLENGSIVDANTLEILLGKKQIPKINIDTSVKSKYAKELDNTKQEVFQAAISNNSIMLIKGPPGTGKTKTITSLIKHFVFEKKEKVILSSKTHATLDNVIISLSVTSSSNNYTGIIFEKSSSSETGHKFTNKDFFIVKNMRNRLLDLIPKNGHVHKLMENEFGPNVSSKRFLAIENNPIHPSLFVGTIASAKLEKRIAFNEYKFNNSILIMDEVSKSIILDVFRYGMYAKQIILVGDDMQLGPIPLPSRELKHFVATLNKKELDIFNQIFQESVFKKLYNKDMNQYMLTTTYRSPQYILDLYNSFAYDNKIISKVKDVKKLKFKNLKKDEKLVKIYSQANKIILNNKEAFHHNSSQASSTSKENEEEIIMLLKQITFLSRSLINHKEFDIMIMFFYKDQHNKFFKTYHSKIKYWEKKFNSLTTGTVDQLQGKEADIVFMCSTYAVKNRKLSNFPKYKIQMQDARRLNVAFSRTKNKLILLINQQVYVDGPIFLDNTKLAYNFNDVFSKFDVKVNI